MHAHFNTANGSAVHFPALTAAERLVRGQVRWPRCSEPEAAAWWAPEQTWGGGKKRLVVPTGAVSTSAWRADAPRARERTETYQGCNAELRRRGRGREERSERFWREKEEPRWLGPTSSVCVWVWLCARGRQSGCAGRERAGFSRDAPLKLLADASSPNKHSKYSSFDTHTFKI